MRFVDPSRLERFVPADWVIRAQEATKELAGALTDAERQIILKRHDGLWRDLGKHLARVMEQKCWYCETLDVRSDHPVDHFRPKGRVAEESGHPGYWWLIYAHENYRYSCTYCNSRRIDQDLGSDGGKQDHFPLLPGGVRAWAPGDSLSDECCVLLDPCESDDVEMLWFDETGVPSARQDLGVDAETRVSTSVELYHWKHGPLATARRLTFRRVSLVCEQADSVYESYTRNDDAGTYARWRELVRALALMIDRSAEHSAAALCAVRGLRTNSRSAEEALQMA